MTKTILSLKDEMNIVIDYTTNNIDIYSICDKYKIGKIKVKDILNKYEVPIRKRGKQSLDKTDFKVSDWKIKKYPEIDGFRYKIYDPLTDFVSKDIENKGGTLTTYIEQQYGVKTPTLYDRRMYYMKTGNYWWEQWLSVEKVENKKTKKCPYCDWETIDIENNSGAFEQHLLKVHNITKQEYINSHPEDKEYFVLVHEGNNRQMEIDESKFVVCKICGRKLSRVDNHHLKIHNITKEEYITRFGVDNLSSEEYHIKQSNASVETNMNMIFHKHSNDEEEITNFIKDNGFECYCDRKTLKGKEIDIFIPSLKIGIEYNGNFWHTEGGGKEPNYHLDKTNMCENNGVQLLQIFEDEYHLKRDIVTSKLSHILKKSKLPKIPGRKCYINEIFKYEAEQFLNDNHIQGFVNASVYIGAFYENKLIAVMTFLKETPLMWNLNRFASDINYVCQGVGSKLFKYFIRNYEYKEIKSFADRRWMSILTRNIYDVMGFKFDGFIRPNYSYYNPKIDRYKRFHKFNFRKNILLQKYPNSGITEDMTENEMTKKLGYDRIWDCGLIKYVYTNPNV